MKKGQFKAKSTEEIKSNIAYFIMSYLDFRQRRAQTFHEGYEFYGKEEERETFIRISEDYQEGASALFNWALNGNNFYPEFLRRVRELEQATTHESKPTRAEVDKALWGKAYEVRT